MDQEPFKELPSNEKIIDELTKDMEKVSAKQEDVKQGASDDPWENIGKEDDEESESAKHDDIPKSQTDEDFIDDEALKSRDSTLSESEKETFKNEADKLKTEGNNYFKDAKNSEDYKKAVSVYTQALKVLPLEFKKERAILFANRAAAKSKFMLEKELVIADCTKAIELDPNYVKAYLRRAHLYEEADKLDEALEDFKKVLSFDPSHAESHYAVKRLPPLIEERNEKLKTEMLGKLKDLGNMILKPFGLSTDNFELQKDPNSGGYSVKFNQNQT